jgi:hypothetical protein
MDDMIRSWRWLFVSAVMCFGIGFEHVAATAQPVFWRWRAIPNSV